eukprot:8505109-Alexandrium_andersonii.AAC.1
MDTDQSPITQADPMWPLAGGGNDRPSGARAGGTPQTAQGPPSQATQPGWQPLAPWPVTNADLLEGGNAGRPVGAVAVGGPARAAQEPA